MWDENPFGQPQCGYQLKKQAKYKNSTNSERAKVNHWSFMFPVDPLSHVVGMMEMIWMMRMQMVTMTMTTATTMIDDELAFSPIVALLEDLHGSVGDEQFPR